MTDAESFIRSATALASAALVPEITLHLATELTPLWLATEAFLAQENMAPPFWAFAWPGAQALARAMLDDPAPVAGKRVLDFAAGCGLAGLAAVRAGAGSVEAVEIDPLAAAAMRLNAAANGLTMDVLCADIVGAPCRWDLILCGDVCYEATMTRTIMPWLERMREAGSAVWIADPGRAYLPRAALRAFASFEVPTSLELEDRTSRTTTLYTLDPRLDAHAMMPTP